MIKIYPSMLNGTIKAPASKADAQRILFASAMPNAPTVINNIPDCKDVEATIASLESFGCRVFKTASNETVVEPFPKNNPVQTAIFDFRSSATTARFSMALAAAYGIKASCRGSSDLLKRHMLPLTSRMAIRGINLTGFSLPLEMSGRLEGGSYEFSGLEESQFVSAILFALPLLLSDSTVTLTGNVADRSHIDMTVSTLRQYGIVIEEKENEIFVPGRQRYVSPGEITAENDWSLASALLCGAAMGAPKGCHLTATGLDTRSLQSYKKLQPLIALISQDFSELTIGLENWPELMTLVAAGAALKGAKASLSGAPQLKHRETDRLSLMAECINRLGGKAAATADGIELEGPNGGDFKEDEPIDCCKDPWIFLSFVLSAPLLKKPVVLTDEECADKIYGGFLKDFEAIGGKYEII